jgi:hypothetical protein
MGVKRPGFQTRTSPLLCNRLFRVDPQGIIIYHTGGHHVWNRPTGYAEKGPPHLKSLGDPTSD